METKDKRVKREIANSNERRRMQSINAGFQKLKRLLPVNDGEKLSKASILQHASEFIQQIEREKLILYDQNTLLRGILMEIKGGTSVTTALETIDLDALPTIPINSRVSMSSGVNISNNNSNSAHNNSNDTTNNNSNDDCIKNLIKDVHIKRDSNNKNSSGKEINKNGNKTCDINAHQSMHHHQHHHHHQQQQQQQHHNMNDKNNFQELAEIISDRVASPKSGLVSLGAAKAAIALPLEVPYTSETAIRVDPHQPKDPQDPKRQNLDTICKAIMEIEGDRVFKNENV